jgi:uncharacterized protein YqjF (DUF2071 family)
MRDGRGLPGDPGPVRPEPVTAEPLPTPAVAPLGAAFTDVTFLHWPYEPAAVRPLLPPGIEPDTFDGAAYVGLVAFRMRSWGEFRELNVRTYSVDSHGRRAVVFLAMEADRLPWVLAARALGLPYCWSAVHVVRDVHLLDYSSSRRWPGRSGPTSRIRIRVGPPIEGGPLEHFLTARWRLHHDIRGVPLATRLAHNRWPLHAAHLVELHDDLIAATGLSAPVAAPVSALFSPGVRGRFGVPEPA